MSKSWNYVALGELGSLIAWGNMSPQRRETVLDFASKIALGPMQPLPQLSDAAPPDEPPVQAIDVKELERAIKQGFEERLGTSTSSPPINGAVPVIIDGRWREVILPPSVVLILGKRGSGKSAMAVPTA